MKISPVSPFKITCALSGISLIFSPRPATVGIALAFAMITAWQVVLPLPKITPAIFSVGILAITDGSISSPQRITAPPSTVFSARPKMRLTTRDR